jgi:phosphogluconate dehydratase
VLADVTARVHERSADSRTAYLARVDAAAARAVGARPVIALVPSSQDLLRPHQPFEDHPRRLRAAVAAAGGTAQVARRAALSQGDVDGALLLAAGDDAVHGLLVAALGSGHLPVVFVPAGPTAPGVPDSERGRVRRLYAEGRVGRAALLEAESAAYPAPGVSASAGTPDRDQVLLEVLGLQLPGSGHVSPGTHLREALTDDAGAQVTRLTRSGGRWTPVGHVVDEKAVVNAVVALLAAGDSSDGARHLVPVAAAAGVHLTEGDVADLAEVVPSMPRGSLVAALLDAGLLHEDVLTVVGRGLSRYREEPTLAGGTLAWQPASPDPALPLLPEGAVPVPTSAGDRAGRLDEDLSWAV